MIKPGEDPSRSSKKNDPVAPNLEGKLPDRTLLDFEPRALKLVAAIENGVPLIKAATHEEFFSPKNGSKSSLKFTIKTVQFETLEFDLALAELPTNVSDDNRRTTFGSLTKGSPLKARNLTSIAARFGVPPNNTIIEAIGANNPLITRDNLPRLMKRNGDGTVTKIKDNSIPKPILDLLLAARANPSNWMWLSVCEFLPDFGGANSRYLLTLDKRELKIFALAEGVAIEKPNLD